MGIDVNTVIAGKLRLVSLLGQGSAGQVWLARHLGLGSDVAIKFLNRDVSADATARERFMREARTIAKIRSPHVVQVHDFGFHEEHAYLVMEHLAGETLEARLERMGALPVEQVMRICTQIAKALQKAHDAGIIHRDIKPANVFLVDYGDEEIAKVVDFGIVKATDGSPVSSRMDTLTQTGSVLGTPYYMSPEQIQDSGNVGHQADLWALGVIAYESLVGSLPFTAPNFAQLVIAICQGTIPVPSTIAPVPPAFDAWVARALDRDPSRRSNPPRSWRGNSARHSSPATTPCPFPTGSSPLTCSGLAPTRQPHHLLKGAEDRLAIPMAPSSPSRARTILPPLRATPSRFARRSRGHPFQEPWCVAPSCLAWPPS
jgi:serine/threonine protein kinase